MFVRLSGLSLSFSFSFLLSLSVCLSVCLSVSFSFFFLFSPSPSLCVHLCFSPPGEGVVTYRNQGLLLKVQSCEGIPSQDKGDNCFNPPPPFLFLTTQEKTETNKQTKTKNTKGRKSCKNMKRRSYGYSSNIRK